MLHTLWILSSKNSLVESIQKNESFFGKNDSIPQSKFEQSWDISNYDSWNYNDVFYVMRSAHVVCASGGVREGGGRMAHLPSSIVGFFTFRWGRIKQLLRINTPTPPHTTLSKYLRTFSCFSNQTKIFSSVTSYLKECHSYRIVNQLILFFLCHTSL